MFRSATLPERGADEVPGRKKSRFKALKTRLFGRLKRKDGEALGKTQSQSTSDITAPEAARGGYDSEDDSHHPKGTLNSRSLSHDSIFLADQAQGPSEPTRVLSQENVPSRIKALQMKLQQQNFHLRRPPVPFPSKRMEDSGATSEDDGLPHSPPDFTFQEPARYHSSYKRNHSCLSLAGTGSEEEEQPPSRPISPWSHSHHRSSSPASPSADFSSPAQFTSCLDTSAARHRVSVKPRNQRPTSKARKLPTSVQRPRSESMHDLILSEGEEDKVDRTANPQEETPRFRSHSAQVVTAERERQLFLDLQADEKQKQRRSLDLELQEEDQVFIPSPEDPLPRSGSALIISEDEEPEQTESEKQVTSNPLYLQPMPDDLQQYEPCDVAESPVPQSVLTDPAAETLEQSVDMQCSVEESVDEEFPMEQSVDMECSEEQSVDVESSGKEQQDICQEKSGNLTEAHKQVPITAEEPLPNIILQKLESEAPPAENEQSVDEPMYEHRPTTQDVGEKSTSSEERRKSLLGDKSTPPVRLADTQIKYQPVTGLNDRTPIPEPSRAGSLKRTPEASGTKTEREIPEVVLRRARVPPAGQENQMSTNGDRSRPSSRPNSGSYQFSVSSAQRRSRIVSSGEWNETCSEEVRKPEHTAIAPLNNSKHTPGKPSNQSEDKPKELPQKHQLAPEKRSIVRRETVPNSSVTTTTTTKTVEEKTNNHVRRAKGPELQGKTAEREEKTNAFGVKLRTTSLSLKYRSETAQSEVRNNKRNSLEAGNKTAASVDVPGPHIGALPSSADRNSSTTLRTETTNKSFAIRKHSSLKSDIILNSTTMPSGSENIRSKETSATSRQQNRLSTSSLGSAEGLKSEPTMRTSLRDKAKAPQQAPLPNQPPLAPTELPPPPPYSARPVHLRPLTLRHANSIAGSTPSKLGTNPSPVATAAQKPAAKETPDRPTVSRATDNTAAQRRRDWANTAVDTRAVVSTSIIEVDQQPTHRIKSAPGPSVTQLSSSSSFLRQSDRSQPSWMELAKRKTSAWNDNNRQ
ncbi:CRACD-like protein [Engraulis encrasicolus]|uniref:CRACD-like protein n=1 Tax=Engraulis encrasicolus TaxID=184585 RepID=UPI002FD043EE